MGTTRGLCAVRHSAACDPVHGEPPRRGVPLWWPCAPESRAGACEQVCSVDRSASRVSLHLSRQAACLIAWLTGSAGPISATKSLPIGGAALEVPRLIRDARCTSQCDRRLPCAVSSGCHETDIKNGSRGRRIRADRQLDPANLRDRTLMRPAFAAGRWDPIGVTRPISCGANPRPAPQLRPQPPASGVLEFPESRRCAPLRRTQRAATIGRRIGRRSMPAAYPRPDAV